MSDDIKMSYNSALYRVRLEFTRAAVRASTEPPLDIVARAKAKLETVKAAGEIAFYYVFESRLVETWEAMRDLEGADDAQKVTFTIGAGTPQLPGVKVEKSTAERAIAAITIEASKEVVSQWQYEWFKVFVLRKLRDLGIKEHPNYAQVFAAFARARAGEKVTALAVGPLSLLPAGGAAPRAFSVVANKQRMEIGVIIRSVAEVARPENREAMLQLVSQAIKQLSGDGVRYTLLKKEFLVALQSAVEGQEGLGVDLPLALLAALGTVVEAKPTSYPGMGKINFQIAKDKMEATIAGFQMAYYEDPSFTVSPEWVQAELHLSGLKVAMADDVKKGLSELIARKKDLNEVLAARGRSSVGGKGPFLYPAFRDAAARAAGDIEAGNIDMREMQQRSTVKAGQLVAELRFEKKPIRGCDVYNDELPPAVDDTLDVSVGEGIQQREPGRYYAVFDGLPQIEQAALSLSRVLVHEGDVNLRTGNIHFDGPVEIKGAIDSGAIVETSGDLIVHGTIRGRLVKVGGNLTAHAGITTGLEGRIYARGNVLAEFIENSSVICGGNLSVAKVLINSNVIVGGKLTLKGQEGVLAGGTVSCRTTISAPNIGFKNGAVTILNVGVDWRVAQRVEIRQKRFERLERKLNEDRQALRELSLKSKAQLTQRHKDLKEELQDRLGRGRALLEACEAYVAKATGQLTYNMDARILVTGQLEANVKITIGGQVVPVPDALASVAVTPKRRRGSFVMALEDLVAEDGPSAA